MLYEASESESILEYSKYAMKMVLVSNITNYKAIHLFVSLFAWTEL